MTFSPSSLLQTLAYRDHIFIGVAGWSYPSWNDLVYPARRPKSFSELAFISQLFNVVEISSTYYHPQSASASQQWLAQVKHNPRFRFTAKIWQKLVLEKFPAGRVWLSPTDVELTKRGMRPLLEAGRLGVLVAPFPQSFHYNSENRDGMWRLLEAFQEYPLVVEIRHNSWNRPELLAELNHRGVGLANIDQPQIGQARALAEITWGRTAYFRFLGRNQRQWLNKDAGVDERYDYLYSVEELDSFAAPIQNALPQAKNTYVIFNNHPRGQAVANALQLQFDLAGIKVNVPEKLLGAYPDLARMRLGINPQQGDLF